MLPTVSVYEVAVLILVLLGSVTVVDVALLIAVVAVPMRST